MRSLHPTVRFTLPLHSYSVRDFVYVVLVHKKNKNSAKFKNVPLIIVLKKSSTDLINKPTMHDKADITTNKCLDILSLEKPTNAKLQLLEDRTETDNGHNDKQLMNLQLESERLKTFKDWNNGAVTPESLAQAGFYSISDGDTVRCAFCQAEGGRWEIGDVPMNDHKAWSPDCPFVLISASSSSDSSASTPIAQPEDQDVCGYKMTPNAANEATLKLLRQLGVEKTKPSSFECYSTKESRLKTFVDWPKSMKQKPEVLSEAGFFYKGVGDQTMCFHCGCGLKDWDDNDDPWEQHALWFPTCSFLLLQKGKDFVANVRRKFKEAPEKCVAGCSTKETKSEECTKKPEDDDGEKASRLCKICYKNELGVVLIPCGHVVLCVDCAHSVKNVCPVCRNKFHAAVRAYLS